MKEDKMDSRYFELTITVPFSVASKTLIDRVGDAIPEELRIDNWNEGRYPFDREKFGDGLKGMLTAAIFQSILRVMQEKYGANHMTPNEDGNGSHNTAYFATVEWMHNELQWIDISLSGEEWRTSLKNIREFVNGNWEDSK